MLPTHRRHRSHAYFYVENVHVCGHSQYYRKLTFTTRVRVKKWVGRVTGSEVFRLVGLTTTMIMPFGLILQFIKFLRIASDVSSFSRDQSSFSLLEH